ncbi:MAG: acyloxyacyl hydrolase, partial [Saprospiraceae bacterium]
MITKSLIGCVVFFFSAIILNAQSGIAVSYAPSKVIKHRQNLLFESSNSREYRLSYTYQTQGNADWDVYWHKPKIVLNFGYVDFGNKAVLGNAISLLPELHFTLKEWKKAKINLQFGSGVAFLNRPYDAVSNPENNAIGSNFNNTSSLKFGLDYQWNNRWSTVLSGGLVHFSNGLSSSPNSGINIYGATIAVNYKFYDIPIEKDNIFETRNDNQSKSYKKWALDIQYNFGIKEHAVPGGPKYRVDAISIGVGYRYSPFLTVTGGLEYEYNDAIYTYYSTNFATENEALDKARSTILYVEQEFRYGRVFSRLRI